MHIKENLVNNLTSNFGTQLPIGKKKVHHTAQRFDFILNQQLKSIVKSYSEQKKCLQGKNGFTFCPNSVVLLITLSITKNCSSACYLSIVFVTMWQEHVFLLKKINEIKLFFNKVIDSLPPKARNNKLRSL
jgi:hypothetical protein